MIADALDYSGVVSAAERGAEGPALNGRSRLQPAETANHRVGARSEGTWGITRDNLFGVKPTGPGRALPLVSDPGGGRAAAPPVGGGGDGGSLRNVVTGVPPGTGFDTAQARPPSTG
jgi:hypothetical protein